MIAWLKQFLSSRADLMARYGAEFEGLKRAHDPRVDLSKSGAEYVVPALQKEWLNWARCKRQDDDVW